MNPDPGSGRAADDLTQLAAWIHEQLASETTDGQAALEQVADDIRALAERLAVDPHSEPERDPDLEEWLRRQLTRARSQAAGPDDENALRQIAAMHDGSVAEQVAVWLRQARDAGNAHQG